MVGEAIVNPLPVPTTDPPHEPVCQFNVVPDPPLTVNDIVPGSSAQKLFLFTAAEVGATGAGLGT